MNKPKTIVLTNKPTKYLFKTKFGSLNSPNNHATGIETIAKATAKTKNFFQVNFLNNFFIK